MEAYTKTLLVLGLTLPLFATGCLPPMAVVQDARTLEKDAVDVTLHADSAMGDQVNVGLRAGYGINGDADLRDGVGAVITPPARRPFAGAWLEVGPKLSLIEDRLALYTPVGIGMIDGGAVAIGTAPTLIGSIDAASWLTFSPFLKGMFGFVGSSLYEPTLIAGVNSSIRIGDTLTIIPEVSYSNTADLSGGLGLRLGF